MPVGVDSTRIMAPMPMQGAKSTMRRHMTVIIWICWISLVARVMSDAVENFSISAGE